MKSSHPLGVTAKQAAVRFSIQAPATFADVGTDRLWPLDEFDGITGKRPAENFNRMRKNFFKNWIAGGITLAAAFGIVGSLEGSGAGYLAVIGPAPLRYQKLSSWKPLNLPPLPMENSSSPDPIAPAIAAADSTNSTSLPGFASSLADLPAEVFLPTTLWLGHLSSWSAADSNLSAGTNFSTNTTQASAPASDLLILTPQMLVDYFKPGQCPTNAAGRFVQVPVEFTPAIPAAPPASSATYKSP